MIRMPLGQAALLLAWSACGCDSGGTSSQAANSATSPSPPPVSNPCAIVASSPGGRVTDPNGPYFHQVAVARTADGQTTTDHARVLEHASVPDAVRTGDGTVRVYYVNGEDGGVWSGVLSGSTLTPTGPIALNGFVRPTGVVDPDASWVNGRVRLAYMSSPRPETGMVRAMCLAESANGVDFTILSTALAVAAQETLTDPSIVQARSGRWLMAMSNGTQTVLARSNDGLSFAEYARVNFGGVPELASLPDGRLRLYVCKAGIEAYVSGDEGLTWTRESVMVPAGTLGARIICDPSLVAGTDLFVFKVQ